MSMFSPTNSSTVRTRHLWRKILPRVVLSIFLVGGGIYLFDEYIKWNLFPKRWGVVEEASIFRSGQLSPTQIRKQIQKHDINVIVSLVSPLPGDSAYEAEKKAVKDHGVEQYVYPLRGNGTGDIKQYAAAIAKIHESVQANKTVLVHCAAGTQRTGGVVASYRILVQGKSVDQAVQEMKRYGWRQTKNPALVPYINEHMSELAGLLIKNGVLERPPDPLPVLSPTI